MAKDSPCSTWHLLSANEALSLSGRALPADAHPSVSLLAFFPLLHTEICHRAELRMPLFTLSLQEILLSFMNTIIFANYQIYIIAQMFLFNLKFLLAVQVIS